MKATVHEPTPTRRILEVEVPADEVAEKKDAVAREFARRISLPGFRKGKTPAALIQKRFQKEIEQEVIEHFVGKYSLELIKEKKLRPLLNPVLEEVRLRTGEPLTFRTAFEIRPQFELGKYRGLEVVRRTLVVDDELVQKNLEAMREAGARLEAVEEGQVLEAGHTAVVDLEPLDATGDEAEPRRGVALDLGPGGAPEALTQQLVGMNPGEAREVTVAPGPSPGATEEKPAPRRYTVTLVAIRRKVLPELDDDFARDQGSFGSLEELRERLREDLERRARDQMADEVREALARKLVESHPFQPPEAMVDQELDRMLRRLAEAMARQGIDPSKADIDWEAKQVEMRAQAEKRSQADLILDEIAAAEDLQVDDDELLAALETEAARLEMSPRALKARLAKEGKLESLKIKMLRQKSLDLVESSANIMAQ